MRRHSNHSLLAGAVVVTAALALTGCSMQSGSGGSGSSSSGSSTARDAAPQPAQDQAVEGKSGGTKSVSPTERDTVITGTVDLTVDSPISAAAKVAALATAAGGRVDARDERAATKDSPASASLTIRVPSTKADRVVRDLKDLGTNAKVTTRADDVTAVHQDTAARIDALESSIARLQQFVTTATKTEDLITLETAISDRQAQLESLQAQQRGLDDQIALATLTVQLNAPSVAVRPAPGDFGSGVVIGWSAFLAFLGWLSVVLGVALPWIVVAAIVLAVVWGVRRVLRRTRGTRPTLPPTPPAPSV